MNREEQWMYKYNLAKVYYEHYGHLEINQKFRTKNGYEYDSEGVCLGSFVRDLRTMYLEGKVSSDKIKLLEEIGMRFVTNKYDVQWMEIYNLAKAFYEKKGHLNIPQFFKTKNGYEYDSDGFKLGTWLSRQKIDFRNGNLKEERILLLEKIGINFEKRTSNFASTHFYKLAKAYYEHHGDLEVTALFKTKNGYEYDEDGYKLGGWVKNQRKFYLNNTLSREKYKLLEEIGMRFITNKKDIAWDNAYMLLKKYYNFYRCLDVPSNFRTLDGIRYDKNGFGLYSWLMRQKNLYNCGELSDERRELLEKLGVDFKIKTDFDRWIDAYNLAVRYYEHYGHLGIRRHFKTKNGYDYDDKGFCLGAWINNQRFKYRVNELEHDKVDLLNSIDMIWNMHKQIYLLRNWCGINNIDYMLNKDVLLYIPYKELIAKDNYLMYKKENRVNPDGRLHEIFSMSNINLEVVYGNTLEKMIQIFYNESSYKKIKRED